MPNKRIDFKTALRKTQEAFKNSQKYKPPENPLMDELFNKTDKKQ